MSAPRDGEGQVERARAQRRVDEVLAQGLEAFLGARLADRRSFSAAELAEAIGIPRFDERRANLFLVALKSQGRATYDWAGWRAGHPTD